MSVAPTPERVYERAVEEGRRRLSMPLLEQIATGFIAGVTIIFGIVALGATHALIAADLGRGVATVAGALPHGTAASLAALAEDIAAKPWEATLVRAILAGALITLLLHAAGLQHGDRADPRVVHRRLLPRPGALRSRDRVGPHLLFGIWDSEVVHYGDLWHNLAVSTVGNIGGGLFLITLTHSAQAKAGR